IRPADPNETVAAWRAAVEHDGPTAIILSRQNVPSLTDGSAVTVGAKVIVSAPDPAAVIVATGSEVGVATDAARELAAQGISANVVSMPSWNLFDEQPAGYRGSVLPPGLPVVSVEAGSTFGWARYADVSVGIDRFGASAPGNVVMDKLGVNVANVVAAVKQAISQ
ncbi:MAG: transketolase, partial [Actinomycetota bacterium]